MTYQIITLDEKNKNRVIWGTFPFTTDKKDAAKIISFLEYIKTSCRNESFLVHELETDKAYKFNDVYQIMIDKLSAVVAAT